MSTKLARTFPEVAVGAVVFLDGKILLVKRQNAPSKNRWALPGGRILPGEHLQDAVKRELHEEAGIEIKPGEAIYVFDVIERNNKDQLSVHYVIIDFTAEYVSGELKAGDDALEVRWVGPEELKSLDVNESTLELLARKFDFK